MPSIMELSTSVLFRLGNPRAQTPNDLQLLNNISTEIRTVKRHQRNTSNPWNFNDYIVDVQAQEATYQIAASDFGTPLAVLTWAPELPTWVARLIPIAQPQNLISNYAAPQNLGGYIYPYDGSQCTAIRCAFCWRNNIPFIEFLPLPQMQCQYKVRYLQSANGVNQLALSESPVTNEDADLVEVRTALALLPIAEWDSPATKDGQRFNAERRKDLYVTLSNTERELRRQFEAAQLLPEGSRLTERWNSCVG